MEPAFAHGCTGALVLRLQDALSKAPFLALDPKDVNGKFGDSTRDAVMKVQLQLKKPETGTVDAAMWKEVVVGKAWPDNFERALQLLAAFEGHGYTKAAGNYDGAGMTWGIVGFTIVWSEVVKDPATKKTKRVYHYNSLHECLTRIFAQQADKAEAAFGKERAKKLKDALALAPAKLFEFAVSITDPNNKNKLLKAWQDSFTTLGQVPEVQRIQEDVARVRYWTPSADIANKFDDLGMQSEQMRQMCFEVLVNPGGFPQSWQEEARERIEQLPGDATLSKKLMEIAKLFEEKALESRKQDIRERKGTIANGFGKVHGKSYRLAGWGFDISEPPLASGLRLAVLSFEETQIEEQLALAEAATATTKYVNAEAAVDLREWWPAGNGTEVVKARTLSLRPLLRPRAADEDSDALASAIGLTFQQPVGILALFGQSPPARASSSRLVFGRGGQGYAGLELDDRGRLRIFRKRVVGGQLEPDQAIDIRDIRPALGHCRLALLYCGSGIPLFPGERTAGILLRQTLGAFGGNPLVLGWFGNGGVPKDADKQIVAPRFFAALKKIGKNKTLEKLCADHESEIVQAWGAACFETFGVFGRQRFLWHDGPFARLKYASDALKRFGLSGAGAIRSDGTVWHSNRAYEGTGDAMVEVKPT